MHGLFYYILCLMPFISIWEVERTQRQTHTAMTLYFREGVRCKSKKDKLELTYKDLLSVNTFQGFDWIKKPLMTVYCYDKKQVAQNLKQLLNLFCQTPWQSKMFIKQDLMVCCCTTYIRIILVNSRRKSIGTKILSIPTKLYRIDKSHYLQTRPVWSKVGLHYPVDKSLSGV